ncbi:MAG: ribonuclease P protein component [Planctomycetota bacterium]
MPRPFSFPRERRLVLGRDFQRVYREGARARGSHVVVVACENGLPRTRLGLSVGKTIWKSAVKRNRIRRVFREAFRLAYADLPVGVDLILIPARPKLVPVLAEIQAELAPLLAQALARKSARARRTTGEAP